MNTPTTITDATTTPDVMICSHAPAGAERLLYTTVDSPIGELLLLGDRDRLRGLRMQRGRKRHAIRPTWTRSAEQFADARTQLEEYFAGARTAFELSLAMHGNGFEQAVWRALLEIPYGETRSYGDLAREVGHPHAARAVGVANARNPIAIVVPCHRVIGADGSLTGYGGGLERKRLLLELESGQASLRV